MRLVIFLIFILTLMTACSQNKKTMRYVALGDSYTIGTGAMEEEAWPVLLTKHLNDKELKTELIANPARNGFTTQNLIDIELPVFDTSAVDFVTVLIGVNDWVRGVSAKIYQENLKFILDHIQSKLSNKKNIILITIPDFGVTPAGKNYGSGRDISKGIEEFNNIIRSEAKKRGLACAELFEKSKEMKDDITLVANDGLHPSAKEYSIWEALIFPKVFAMLK